MMNVVPKRRSGGDPDLLRQVLTKNLVAVASGETSFENGSSSHLPSPSFTPETLVSNIHHRRLSLQEHSRVNDTLESCFEEMVAYRHPGKRFVSPEAKRRSSSTALPINVNVSPPTPENMPHHIDNNNIDNNGHNNNNDNNHLYDPCSSDVMCPFTNFNDRTSLNLPLPSQYPSEDLNMLSNTSSLTPAFSTSGASFSFPDDPTTALRHLRHKHQALSGSFSLSPVLTSSPRSNLSPAKVLRRNDIIFGDIIGKGGFGKVYTGNLHGRPVAIKVVQKRRGSGIHREILQAERLAFSLSLRHENIVNILGINLCDGLRGDALIIMELVSPQTLQSVLDDVNRTISQSLRLKFASEITKALCYLHSNDVAHLDVKPRNVLMTHDETCKLADFGSLTRTRTDVPREETDFTQLLGTLPYRAPELMKGCFPTNKADVYSLGITLWQLVTRETPHSGANPHVLIYQVTKGNKRPDIHDPGNDSTEVKYRDLYVACWDADPDLRPHASDVDDFLETMLPAGWDVGWEEVGGRSE